MAILKLIAVACSLAMAATGVLAQKTTLEHQSGSKTTVTSTKEGTEVKGEAKNGGQPSGTEKNTQGHKENVDRVKGEAKDRGDPVVKENGRVVK